MKILYFGNPNSIHDRKWITHFSEEEKNTCYLLCLPHQLDQTSGETKQELKENNIILIGAIPEFSVIRFWQTWRSLRYIKRLVDENKISIIHILFAEPNALWAVGKRFFKVPFILTTRGTDVIKTIPIFFNSWSPLKLIVKRLYKKALRNFDEITCTSKSQVSALISLIGPSFTPHLIRTGIDLHSSASSIQPKGIIKPFIFFPRLMKPIYNHEFSIRSLTKTSPEVKNHQLVFVNKDSEDQNYVNSINELMNQYTDLNFLFLNSLPQEQMRWALSNASLAIMNPLHDGSAVSAMEAMYFKCPLVLGPIDYDQDLFGEIDQIQDWDENELAQKVGKMVSHPNDQKLDKLKLIVSEKADRRKEMEKLGAIYSKLI